MGMRGWRLRPEAGGVGSCFFLGSAVFAAFIFWVRVFWVFGSSHHLCDFIWVLLAFKFMCPGFWFIHGLPPPSPSHRYSALFQYTSVVCTPYADTRLDISSHMDISIHGRYTYIR